jgi:ADP-ribose pyrophosphatase YjhB (NUDIX family)
MPGHVVARPYCSCVGELDGWKHCPVCATGVAPEDGHFECPVCGFVTYAHSMPTASAVVGDGEGRLLLSRRALDPFAGKWDLPGGFLEEGEPPLDCLRRELREEAGIGLSDERLLGIWMDRYEYKQRLVATLNIYYAARLGDGTLEPGDDVAELRWFAEDEVPADELAFGHIPAVLSAARGNEHA